MSEVYVDLLTIGGGELNDEVKSLIPPLMTALKQGQSASINVSIGFKRVEDTATMVKITYSVKPTFPAKKKTGICQVTGDNRLKTDAPMEKPKVINLFNDNKGGQVNE